MKPKFRQRDQQKDYEDFEASELFCPRCKMSVPVFKKLLLVLPQGEKYLYLCSRCGAETGEKLVTMTQSQEGIILR